MDSILCASLADSMAATARAAAAVAAAGAAARAAAAAVAAATRMAAVEKVGEQQAAVRAVGMWGKLAAVWREEPTLLMFPES